MVTGKDYEYDESHPQWLLTLYSSSNKASEYELSGPGYNKEDEQKEPQSLFPGAHRPNSIGQEGYQRRRTNK
jgi:hypothetical protein